MQNYKQEDLITCFDLELTNLALLTFVVLWKLQLQYEIFKFTQKAQLGHHSHMLVRGTFYYCFTH